MPFSMVLSYTDTKEFSPAALEELFAAAKDEAGLTLYAASGYRSYGTQSAIFERKIKNN